MRILFCISSLANNPLDVVGAYLSEIMRRLQEPHPEHECVGLEQWKRLVGPELMINPYASCKLLTRIPQIMVVPDESIANKGFWRKRLQSLYFRKVSRIITLSDFAAKEIRLLYPKHAHKISVVPGAARSSFQPLSWDDREAVKNGYADGREYFLYFSPHPSLPQQMQLLKAFSLFKQWQQSNMKLVLVRQQVSAKDLLSQKLKNYKYREDVVFVNDPSETQWQALTAAAYAFIYTTQLPQSALPILDAMQCGVPVLTSKTGGLEETGKDAVLYANPNDPDAMAQQLILLYKNENNRNTLIAAGKSQASRHHWDTATQSFLQQILTLKSQQPIANSQ